MRSVTSRELCRRTGRRVRRASRTALINVGLLTVLSLGAGVGCSSGGGSGGARVLKPSDFVVGSTGIAVGRDEGTLIAASTETPDGHDASTNGSQSELPEPLPAGLDVPADDGGDPSAADAAVGAKSKPDAKPEAKSDAKPEAKSDAKPDARAKAGAKAVPPANPGGGPSPAPRDPIQVKPKESWIVDGLIGQINGRPVFADEFLDPMSDRLRQIVQEYDRPESRRGIMQLVSQRFDQWVDSELIIAEAESLMTPEQKQGVVAWLRDLQEGEIVKRGGTRTSAESSLQDQMGVTMEEFLEATKDRAMAGDLLRRRVQPRAIVTWRDMEREFRRRSGEFAPGAKIVLGRIALRTATEGVKIKLVTDCFARGQSFSEVAKELAIPDDGRWLEFKLGEEGIAGIKDLRDELKAKLAELPVGGVSEPIVQGSTTVWLSLLAKEEPPPRSIYERDLQLALRNELQGEREELERQRYIASLRKRWIADGIEDMRSRLIDIALKRYWM